MPKQAAAVNVENNFRNGLVTEATGLNFPENACPETYNCVFNIDGSVSRREGFDFEIGYTEKTINRSDSAISTYLWKNVSADGELSLWVVQVGAAVYFYKNSSTSLSSGAVSSSVTLTAVSGASSVSTVEAQFSDGNGLLFITHPYCEPMRVAYDTTTDTATATNITIQIRDFEGDTADANAVDTRPTASLAGLEAHHKYNLYNQGWDANGTTNLTTWDTAFTTMPSNADVMWRFKNASDAFDTATVPNVVVGNTEAPKGHFILTLSNQDRSAKVSGATATTTGHQRPSTSAFFAGRVFYSGINYSGFNSKIYFSQIIERVGQYGQCFQQNDPTAEDLFDLLPSDGGVISIPEAGTVYKLFTMPGGMSVFAANGVWLVTGSTGLGFTANDYTVQKIANINTLSASSFVDVGGFPAWWNAEGIYLMGVDKATPVIRSLSDAKIKSFFGDIPMGSKRYAKGFFHPVEGIIQWIYRSEETTQINELYEYDLALNFNIHTGAFYPWTISDGDVKINSLVVSDGLQGSITSSTVVNAGGDFVIDSSGDQVISFNVSTSLGGAAPADKYLVSYPSAGSYKFTVAETNNGDHIDWVTYDDDGVNFDSYFTAGYKLRGGGLRKFQNNWIRVFSDTTLANSYYVQGLWNYAITGSETGKWSPKQIVEHTDTNYSVSSSRRKIRGHGVALQVKISSVEGSPFEIIGWSSLDSVNPIP